jgi:hypothetical protein
LKVQPQQGLSSTHRTFGGAIRVVIVKEPPRSRFFHCTDVNANVREIIEAFADRRKALQAACLAEDFSHAPSGGSLRRKFRNVLQRLPRIAL